MGDVHFRGPNILITGTPGTGKTTLAREIAQASGLKHVSISELAKECGALDNFDDELQTWELDEDKVIDEIDEDMREGGHIIEYHSSEWFPERWFDVVFVLRVDNTLLYKRLEKRNYPERKIQENVQCEIFQTILGSLSSEPTAHLSIYL